MPLNETPSNICHSIICHKQAYNREHNILPSANLVADRLLCRHDEMRDVYAELHEKLGYDESLLGIFFDIVLEIPVFWSPERNNQARLKRERLKQLNEEVSRIAALLADRLDERDALHETSGFRSKTYFDPVDLIKEASAQNCLFDTYVKASLTKLRCRYDLKYWPSISDCVRALARDAAEAEVEASDPLTDAATNASRNSRADFLRVFFAAIEENSGENAGQFPSDFRITDASVASLVNCVLDLGPENLIDSAYVKRMRQRERERMGALGQADRNH